MRMRDLANAFANSEEKKFINSIDKEVERLIQLRFVSKIIETVKQLHYKIVSEHMNKNFKCTIEQTSTFPQSWGLIYNVGGNKGRVQINERDLELLSKGFESIRDNKILMLASTGINVEHNFEQKLIYMLIGPTLYNEYFKHALETEMNMV